MDMFLIFNHIQISPKSILYTLWGLGGYNGGHRSDVFFKSQDYALTRLKSQARTLAAYKVQPATLRA